MPTLNCIRSVSLQSWVGAKWMEKIVGPATRLASTPTPTGIRPATSTGWVLVELIETKCRTPAKTTSIQTPNNIRSVASRDWVGVELIKNCRLLYKQARMVFKNWVSLNHATETLVCR
jgi:hypothetical protein